MAITLIVCTQEITVKQLPQQWSNISGLITSCDKGQSQYRTRSLARKCRAQQPDVTVQSSFVLLLLSLASDAIQRFAVYQRGQV